jgi:hypothetical protein
VSDSRVIILSSAAISDRCTSVSLVKARGRSEISPSPRTEVLHFGSLGTAIVRGASIGVTLRIVDHADSHAFDLEARPGALADRACLGSRPERRARDRASASRECGPVCKQAPSSHENPMAYKAQD